MNRNRLLWMAIILFLLPAFIKAQSGGNYSKGIYDSYKNYSIRNSEVRTAINFVNDKLRYGNQYDVQFRIDESKKILITRSTYYEVVYPLATVEKFVFENKLIKINCFSNHGGCITSIDRGSGSTTNNNSWSLNLDVDATVGKEVVEKLELIKTILGGTDYYLGFNSKIKQSLNYINQQMEKYNEYHIHFWVNINTNNLVFRSDYYEVEIDPKALSDITFSGSILKFACSGNCVTSTDIESRSVTNNYERTINFNGDAYTADKVIQEFKNIQKELGGSSYVNNNNYTPSYGDNYSKGIYDSYKYKTPSNYNIKTALNYINTKMNAYNGYNMDFRVDENKKIFVAKSDYYEIVFPIAKLERVTFANNIVSFKCYDFCGECITNISNSSGSTDKDANRTVDLKVDATTGKEVVEKFEEIKTLLAGTDFYLGNSSTIRNSLNTINNLFSQYNSYHFTWWVDGNKKLKFRSDYYEGIVDPYKLSDISYSGKIVSISGSTGCVQEYSIGSGNSLSSSSSRTINFDSDSYGPQVVDELKKVVNELGGKLSTSGGKTGGYTPTSGSYSKGIFDSYKYKTPSNYTIKTALNYINTQMNAYNGYNMDFRVDENKKIFIAKSDYYEIVFPIAQLEKITFSGKIVSFKCYDFCSECITNISNSSGSIDKDANRTVDLKVDDATGKKVVEKFEEIKTLLAGTDFYLGNNSTIRSSLTTINDYFRQYNSYHFSWWVDGNKKLKFRSDYYEGIVDPYKLTDISYSGNIVTLSGSSGCVQEYSIGSGSSLSSSSSRTINFDSDTYGNKVVDEMKKVVRELGGSLSGTSNYNNVNVNDNNTPPVVSSNQKIKESLDFINQQFKKYNQYGVQFRVDEYNKTLISKSVYFEVTYPLSSISAFENPTGLIKFNCSYGKCIKSRDLETNNVNNYESYTVNFDGNEAIAEVVLKAFETIKGEMK